MQTVGQNCKSCGKTIHFSADALACLHCNAAHHIACLDGQHTCPHCGKDLPKYSAREPAAREPNAPSPSPPPLPKLPKPLETQAQILSRLRRNNPDMAAYLQRNRAGSFFLTKETMTAKYEEVITHEATQLFMQQSAEHEKKLREAQETHASLLISFLPKLDSYTETTEYIDLPAPDRQALDALVNYIQQKPLDAWSESEKRVIKFYRTATRSGIPQTQDAAKADQPTAVTAAEMRAFMATIRHYQAEQLRLLAAIRWAIIGFSIWFIIQFWFLPKLLLSSSR
jgi:hypothetical protein